ncbi:MAG: winged helix-turn-helix transcriptional regulator [Gammaproteobacteria bacterium]|nr:winged helix-turn-helix transcriptional regulator [Gammaproteobacteria bacterium]
MSAFQDTREQTQQKTLVHLLSEIDRNPSFTQRGLAAELGIALGLMNQYLKRCMTKGWVRASQLSPRRIRYFITPEGFKEKGLMVTDYLSRSMTFFRDARAQCEEAFAYAKAQNWVNIALVGPGDLADIGQLVAQGMDLSLQVVDKTAADFSHFDAVLITDIMDPQGTYVAIKGKVEAQHVLVLPLLHISMGTTPSI